MKIAALTMVYNEPDYMGPWCRHYGAQVGPENCWVIDHGSDDGSTEGLGAVNVLRVDRSPMDDDMRARLVSDVCAELLLRYDVVIHGDVDEFLVADPRRYTGLADCARHMGGPVRHAIGLEVWHRAEDEAPIDLSHPVSEQRRWLWFNSALCKPAMTAERVRWAPGFHSILEPHAAAPLAFDHLYLFHLRYFDEARGLQRLARTRAMPWAHDYAGGHQRMVDEEWLKRLRYVAGLPQEGGDLDPATPPLAPLLEAVSASQAGRETDAYKIALNILGHSLIPLPERFRGTF